MKDFILFAQALITIFLTDPVAQAGECGIVKDWRVLTAQWYHGILSSTENEKGEFFWRDGQRCRLYTSGYLKSLERSGE